LVDPIISAVRSASTSDVPRAKILCSELQRAFDPGETPAYSVFDNFEHQKAHKRISFRDRIEHSLRKASPGFDPANPMILSLSYHPIRLTVTEEVGHIKLMFLYLEQYDSAEPSRGKEVKVNERIIYALHKWRRHARVTLSRLKHLVEFISYWSSKQDDEKAFEMLLKDINDLSLQTKDLVNALENTMTVVTSMIQLLDARRSISEATDIKRVTYIALVFVPLSWVAGLFSMTDEYSPGGSRFWMYFVVSLPLVALVLSLSALSFQGFLLLSLSCGKLLRRRRFNFSASSREKGGNVSPGV
jgi:Mg2+ and Co2+ transporter CorA